MAWVLLVVAGILEVAWAIGLKYTEGFTRPLPTALTAIALVGSIGLLALAVRDLPIGTGYAIWVGIGAVGTALLSMVLFDEPATPARLGLLALLIVAIAGLKLTSNGAS
jgi:quaternary ammonium compound-resistance protein SugE